MIRFKRVLSIAAVGMLILSTTGCVIKTQEGKDNTVVAKIGDKKIVVADVNKQMKSNIDSLVSQYGANYKSNATAMETLKSDYKTTLESMAKQKLVYLRAVKENVNLDPKDIPGSVNKLVDMVKQTQFDNDQSKLDTALSGASMTMDSWKDSLKEQMLEDMEAVTASYFQMYDTKGVTVKDDEIQKYYNDNISTYTTQPGATLSHILVDSEDKAKEVKTKLQNGAKFEDLAKEYSTDPGSKDSGGSLGYVAYDDTKYDADFLAGAKKLAEGQISDPVKSQFGWHIIKATGVQKDKKVKPLSEVKDDIKAQVLNTNRSNKFNSDIETWKKDMGYTLYEDKLISNAI